MRALLDVNVLTALLDTEHVSHDTAALWMTTNARLGWATCPITQNGCVRVMSGSGYSRPLPVLAVAERLRIAVSHPLHQFWNDDISLLDPSCIDTTRLHGPLQLTYAYLLGMAVAHGGRLVTFDRRITTTAVIGARPEHLVVL
jgi:toxin-antitoxin system PIN domain toxin